MAENAALGQMALCVGLGALARYKYMPWHGRELRVLYHSGTIQTWRLQFTAHRA
ncbi:hypothetical protein POSPLADRAFT_1038694 [Postia placenta MAD-698-R-SB12]|uniref:Uncharacterized protein n=1 Tax=Postia placenta MAD-698-R-SB12 TaxID=670580 RepID=A0A1X6NDG4_9APHY|nr:hypothetical protein POSPLADRAFT_1038694 [Postia placenta MAD-698-R-SB12]OSX66687.1 hypothetical protein POSPLADRAFT_1038694 [Postia placenta MAD-698-R-SB12]